MRICCCEILLPSILKGSTGLWSPVICFLMALRIMSAVLDLPQVKDVLDSCLSFLIFL